jgi:hypothetical protein
VRKATKVIVGVGAAVALTSGAFKIINAIQGDNDVTFRDAYVAEVRAQVRAEAASGCQTGHVVIWQDDPTPCDILPGWRLDVVFDLAVEDKAPEMCDDMGGTFNAKTFTCEDVDF